MVRRPPVGRAQLWKQVRVKGPIGTLSNWRVLPWKWRRRPVIEGARRSNRGVSFT